MLIDEATVEDAAGIAGSHLSSLQASHERFLPESAAHLVLDATDVEARARSWRKWIQRSRVSTFVARDGGTVCGFCTVQSLPEQPLPAQPPTSEQRGTSAEIAALFVAESHWRRGIGRLLCERTVARAGELGFSDVALWVLEVNEPARAFYQSMGFRPDGEVRVFLEVSPAPLRELRYRRSTAASA